MVPVTLFALGSDRTSVRYCELTQHVVVRGNVWISSLGRQPLLPVNQIRGSTAQSLSIREFGGMLWTGPSASSNAWVATGAGSSRLRWIRPKNERTCPRRFPWFRFRLQQRVNGIYREWDRSSLITKEAYSEYFVGSPLDDNGTGRVGGIRYAMLGTVVVGRIQRSQRRRRLSCRLFVIVVLR